MSQAPDAKLRVRVGRALDELEEFLGIQADDLQGDFLDPRASGFDEEHDPLIASDQLVLDLPRCDCAPLKLTYDELPGLADESP